MHGETIRITIRIMGVCLDTPVITSYSENSKIESQTTGRQD